jgi:hypothetical protein
MITFLSLAFLFFSSLFLLMVGHAVVDFALQSDTLAREKSRHSESELQKHVPWYYWLTAHALMHGGVVSLITGSVILGMLETISHWLIDFMKCEGYIDIHQDQFAHFLCKIAWVAFWL